MFSLCLNFLKLLSHASVLVFGFFFLFQYMLFSQGVWTVITDPLNPVVTFSNNTMYRGASWVDIDNDGDIDLFAAPEFLFLNDGHGNFTTRITIIGSGQVQRPSGSSWADINGDGYIDCFLARNPSQFYLNNGDGSFRLDTVAFGNNSGYNGWGAALADYNNDGLLDLTIAHPAGFLPGEPTPSFLFKRSPSGAYNKITGYDFVTNTGAYTVPYWSDFDLDGDMDLFIASGPGGTAWYDYCYKNLLKETGKDSLAKISNLPFASQTQDGQTYNFIDYDNDGDLDLCLTNWQGAPNRFYRNDAGVYTAVSTPFTAPNVSSLANSWGDLDNDGDLDCIIANDAGVAMGYYLNNGDGTFSAQNNGITVRKNGSCVTLGDYDNDGDLDMFVMGSGKFLARNDGISAGRSFLSLAVSGNGTNRSAIGAKVFLSAVINGNRVRQMRDISAQNTFQGQNDLRVHFGLGNASIADTVTIVYPDGTTNTFTSVSANRFYRAQQGVTTLTFLSSEEEEKNDMPTEFMLSQNFPNPFNPSTKIGFTVPPGNGTDAVSVTLKIYNLFGELVAVPISDNLKPGYHETEFNGNGLPSGVYLYRLDVAGRSETKKMNLLK